MKRIISLTLVLVLAALCLAGCGKSEFGMSENTEKRMTVTAENAEEGAFFMVGSLEVAEGEQVSITANLSKGSVRVELIGAPTEGIEEVPDLNAEAILTADLKGTDSSAGTLEAGSYLLKATCLEQATGTVQVEVTAAENP